MPARGAESADCLATWCLLVGAATVEGNDCQVCQARGTAQTCQSPHCVSTCNASTVANPHNVIMLLNVQQAHRDKQDTPTLCPRLCTALCHCRELTLVPPMLGMSQQLINRDHTSTYYTGMPACKATGRPLRKHGDEIARLPGGYYRALGRVDDTMNLGGIKVRARLGGAVGKQSMQHEKRWQRLAGCRYNLEGLLTEVTPQTF